MNHGHFELEVRGPLMPAKEFVNVVAAAVLCQDGTVAMISAHCFSEDEAVAWLAELGEQIDAHGLDHVEPRVEP